MPELPTDAPRTDLAESDKIAALEAELLHAQRSSNEFLIGVNHRFRTPLNGVNGMLMMLAATNLSKDQRSFVESALNSSRSLMRTFDELLDYCRGEAGELILACEPFSPESAIDSILAEFTAEAEERGVALTRAASSAMPSTIQGDAPRLHQILHELVGNALRHTTAGEVEVGAQTHMDKSAESKLLFWVKDSGCGLSKEQLMHPFDLTTDDTGTADIHIGLPAVHHIVDAMGGSIEIESEEGVGTTVQFTIPTGASRHAAEVFGAGIIPTTEDAQEEDRRPAQILIVENDPVNQRVTQGFLKLAGYEGTIVDSGENALKALAADDFDMVLMEKVMPGMTGIAVADAIREGRNGVLNANIPIIALTAEVGLSARRECFAAGMNAYLSKPIRKDEFDSVIRNWLPPSLRPEPPAAE